MTEPDVPARSSSMVLGNCARAPSCAKLCRVASAAADWKIACRLLPVRLDGSDLPPELAGINSLEGFGAAERILARGAELMTTERLSRRQANERILREFRDEGVDLTPEQSRALAAYLGTLQRLLVAGAAAVLSWLLATTSGAAVIVPAAIGVAGTGFFVGRHFDVSQSSQTQLKQCQASLPQPPSGSTGVSIDY